MKGKVSETNGSAGVSVNQRDKNGLNVLAKAAESASKRQRLEGKISETNGSAGVSVNQRDKNRLNMLLKAAELVSKRQRLDVPEPEQTKRRRLEVPEPEQISVVKVQIGSKGQRFKNYEKDSNGNHKAKGISLLDGTSYEEWEMDSSRNEKAKLLIFTL